MKRTTRIIVCVLSVPMLCLSFGGMAGCDRETTAQLVVLSGAYLGDIVTTVSTQYWLDQLGVEGETDAVAEGGHSHDTEPMHDHEH